jgi:FkbM family methyltransferase
MFKKRLRELHASPLLPQDHVQYMHYMRDTLHIQPKVCYDIGACVLHWTHQAEKVWPQSQFILFEAMDDVEFLYQEKNYLYELGAFSDSDGKVIDFYQNTYHPGGNSYYQENEIFSPSAAYLFGEDNIVRKISKSIDTVVKERNFPLPDLIKIDVQGCELDILKGMQETLKSCADLIVEMQRIPYNKGAPLVDETTEFILSQGFVLQTARFSNSRAEAPDSDYHFRKPT